MIEENVEESFSDWISSPQMLVGLSAILLSLCGLFVSIYEASLMRQQQRASAWPHVEVGPSFSGRSVELVVRNTGVGPARIRAANVTHRDGVRSDWDTLLRSVTAADVNPDSIGYSFSLISGQVLPPQSDREDLFALEADDDTELRPVRQIQRAVRAGELNVTVCYCSVYDQCWRTTMQDGLRVMRGGDPARHQSVESCEGVAQSSI